ncbi:hypothetical protein ABGB07_36180 [Micromonosporaceae bacterium B7E4]
MIQHDGQRYGTAAEIGKLLGVRPHVIRNYAARDGLTAVRMEDEHGRPQVRYPVDQASEIEHAKRTSGRGAPRTLLPA